MPWVFDQSEHVQGPIYIVMIIKKPSNLFITIYQWHPENFFTGSLNYFETFVLRTVLYGAVKAEVVSLICIAFCAFLQSLC